MGEAGGVEVVDLDAGVGKHGLWLGSVLVGELFNVVVDDLKHLGYVAEVVGIVEKRLGVLLPSIITQE